MKYRVYLTDPERPGLKIVYARQCSSRELADGWARVALKNAQQGLEVHVEPEDSTSV